MVTIVALALVATMVAVAAGLLRSRSIGIRLVDRDVRTAALADAAMAEMLARLASDRDAADLATRPFGHGSIRAAVDRSSGSDVVVEAVGTSGEWEVVLIAAVQWSGSRPRVVRWERRVRSISG